uniref:ATP synthase subunit d, mitochondrial-like n=1 Tax=Styela clava TaxID=7725 RepID=UPI00193A30B7|nr:ATP synthase subunit d, mitochondrial-like [Styela clava]
MASKQAAVKVVNWSQLLERTTAQTRPRILAFKNKTDAIVAANLKAKGQDASINWDHYQNVVTDQALVADFKQKFESFKVPQPVDNKSAQLNEKAKADIAAVTKFNEELDAKINNIRVNLDRLLSLPAVEQLTIDDIYEHFPQRRPDYQKYPYWPHRHPNDLSKFYEQYS